MTSGSTPAARAALPRRGRNWRRLTLACLAVGVFLRLSFLTWQDPWRPHHPDEGILPLEALALWEGVTPREVGWPASTLRLTLSVAAANAWAIQAGHTAWQQRAAPERALQTITDWIGRQYVDPTLMFRIGRVLVFITGLIQMLVAVWSLRRWVPDAGVFAGTAVMALGAVPIAYSQYLLADMAGLLFATTLMGLAARPTPGAIRTMSVLAGLAAASKFHFGLWLLTPVLCVWLLRDGGVARWRNTFATLGLAAAVLLALVPWLWIDPALGLKEFTAVVLVKIGKGSTEASFFRNAAITFGALGALAWIGGVIGAASLRRDELRRLLPILVPTIVGGLVILSSEVVFDRYALVLFPGVALLAAFGWQRLLDADRAGVRRIGAGLLAGALVWAAVAEIRSDLRQRETDVDVLAEQWVLAHVARGRRVAVYDETVAPLPRTASALERCIQRVDGPHAYEEKLAVEGLHVPAGDAEPMRSAVLTDERFFAYWCRRERDVQRDPGYDVVLYNAEPRFWAIPERQALEDFREGRLDVLVANGPVQVGRPPGAVLQTRRGARVIYTAD